MFLTKPGKLFLPFSPLMLRLIGCDCSSIFTDCTWEWGYSKSMQKKLQHDLFVTLVDLIHPVLQYSSLALILISPLSLCLLQHYLITHLPRSLHLCKLPMAAVHRAIFLDVVWSSSSRQLSQQVIHQIPVPSSTLPGRCGHMARPCPLVPAHNNRLRLSRGSSHHCLAIYLSVKVVIIYGPRQVTVVRLWTWRFEPGCSITRCFSLTCAECMLQCCPQEQLWVVFYVSDWLKVLHTSLNLAKNHCRLLKENGTLWSDNQRQFY